MNSPPSSLATILQFQSSTAAAASAAQAQAQPPQPSAADEDGVAILTYLHEAAGQLPYPEAVGAQQQANGGADGHAEGGRSEHDPAITAAASSLNNTDAYRLMWAKRAHGITSPAHPAGGEALPIDAPAPGSPIDTSVPIPDALASLPPPPDARYLTPLSGLPAALGTEAVSVSLTDRGEMGGKRRKALHERAGWKDMDDITVHRDKRARGDNMAPGEQSSFLQDYTAVTIDDVTAAAAASAGAAGAAPGAEAVDGADSSQALAAAVPTPAAAEDVSGMDAVIAVATAAAAANNPASSNTGPADAVQSESEKASAGRGRGGGKLTKASRAEQNRKAQQIFRRRREEKIKQLEADAAALATTRARLQVAEARIEQLALDLEAKTIESHALRTAVLTISKNMSASVVTPQDALTITDADWERRDQDVHGEMEGGRTQIALDNLARASRQMAKMNRAHRMAEKHQNETHVQPPAAAGALADSQAETAVENADPAMAAAAAAAAAAVAAPSEAQKADETPAQP